MSSTSWGGTVNNTAGFTAGPAYPYYDFVPALTCRQAANGARPLRVDSVAIGYASGSGTPQVRIGSTTSGGGGTIVPDAPTSGFYRFQYIPSGGNNFGRNTAPPYNVQIVQWSDGDTPLTGSMPGSMTYSEVASPAQTPAVAPSGVGSALVSWSAPADNGGAAITGYDIEWATNAGFTTGLGSKSVGVVTSDTVTGLTPGTLYYFRIKAKNAVSTGAGTTSMPSSTVSATMGTAPGAPTGLTVVTNPGVAGVSWVAPASDGGVAIDYYVVDVATDSGFTAIVRTEVPDGVEGANARDWAFTGLTPGTLYYFRVRAHNSVGDGANATAVSATIPARGVLDVVQGAAVDVSGGVQVEVRSDGATPAVLTLGYTVFGTGTAFVAIATLSVGATAADFAAPGNPRGIALVADPAGNLYVIGRRGDSANTLLVKRFARSATTTWAAAGVSSQSIGGGTLPIESLAAAYVPGSGVTPKPSIFVLARFLPRYRFAEMGYATIDPDVVTASGAAPLIAYGYDAGVMTWLSYPGSVNPVAGTVDVEAFPAIPTRLALLGNGWAVIDVTNGVVSGVAKPASGTTLTPNWGRVLPVSATAFVLLTVNGAGALSWSFYGTNGSLLGQGTYAGANAQGGAFARQWDAFYDVVSGLVTVFYVADDAGARVLESIDISPATYTAAAAVVLTSALGAASSTNGAVRIPGGVVDERRVLVAADNLLTGAKSTATYSDRSGNVVPTAPAVVDIAGFDATQAYLFAWAFGDPNPADTQTAYELQVQRVSDSVDVVSTGKVVSTVSSRSVVANTLANGVNYRWRVRTYDVLDNVGAWSSYDTFTTAATGTLTITTPAVDNVPTYDVSSLNVVWSYVQANGYVQTQRRVRMIRVSDGTVLSDTTMQASTTGNYTVTAIPTDVPVRIEVSIVTNAPGTPTVTTNRLLTSSYGAPMTPELTVVNGPSYVEIAVNNPTPSGSRPEVIRNEIDRREHSVGGAYTTIAKINRNSSYRDHAVKSGTQYDYRVRGVSA